MSDTSIETLEELLSTLARTRSLRGRLRVLGHSWSLLRSLSPSQREQVSLRFGSRWVWKRLEKSFLKDGQLSETERMVGRAFEHMGESDPRELRKFAKMLKQGDSDGAQDLLMSTLTAALEEEAAAEDEVERLETDLPNELKAALLANETTAALAEHVAAQSDEPTESTAARTNATELVDSAEGVLASSHAENVGGPTHEQPPRSRVLPTPHELPEVQKPAPSWSEPPLPSETPSGLDRESTFESTSKKRDAREILRTLRALHGSSRPCADVGQSGRAELIDSLGGGWASRRALSRLIETHSLDDLDEALRLIRDLERSSQQAWCLADLLEHWELDAGDVERILGAAPSEGVRRRLAGRSCERSAETPPLDSQIR